MNTRIEMFSKVYPDLVTVYDAINQFHIDSKLYCGNEICKHYVITLHNKRFSSMAYLPQILLSGELHGDEIVSPEALMEFIDYMLQNRAYFDSSYYQSTIPFEFKYIASTWLSFLMDTREIVIIPITNAWGFHEHIRNEKIIDVNRDFPFDMNTKNSPCLQSVASQVIKHVMDSNLFVSTITYHAGMMAISYDWGDTRRSSNISPDYYAFQTLASSMANYAGRFGTDAYAVGPINSIVYPVKGGLEEYAYAGSWNDKYSAVKKIPPGCNNVDFIPPNNITNRQLIFLIEATNEKIPSISSLGRRKDILIPSSIERKQYIPMIMRTALTLVDMTYPYIYIRSVHYSDTGDQLFLEGLVNQTNPQRNQSQLFEAMNNSHSSFESLLRNFYDQQDINVNVPPQKKPISFFDSFSKSRKKLIISKETATGVYDSYVNINITWSVGGCSHVDQTLLYIYSRDSLLSIYSQYLSSVNGSLLFDNNGTIFGEQDIEKYRQWMADYKNIIPYITPIYITKAQMGNCYWNSSTPSPYDLSSRPSFNATVSIPSSYKDIFIIAVTQVDQQFLQKQSTVNPDIDPQTHFANIRGNTSWYAANKNHVIQGHDYFYSLPVYVYLDNQNQNYIEDRIHFLINTSFLRHVPTKPISFLYLPDVSQYPISTAFLIYKILLLSLVCIAAIVYFYKQRKIYTRICVFLNKKSHKHSPSGRRSPFPFNKTKSFSTFDYYYEFEYDSDE